VEVSECDREIKGSWATIKRAHTQTRTQHAYTHTHTHTNTRTHTHNTHNTHTHAHTHTHTHTHLLRTCPPIKRPLQPAVRRARSAPAPSTAIACGPRPPVAMPAVSSRSAAHLAGGDVRLVTCVYEGREERRRVGEEERARARGRKSARASPLRTRASSKAREMSPVACRGCSGHHYHTHGSSNCRRACYLYTHWSITLPAGRKKSPVELWKGCQSWSAAR